MSDVLVFDTEAQPTATVIEQPGEWLLFDVPTTIKAIEAEPGTDLLLFDAAEPQVTIQEFIQDFLIIDAPEVPTTLVSDDPNADFIVITSGGPKGEQGPKGEPGDPGVVDYTSVTYTHRQEISSAIWDIRHPLQFRPAVTVIDSSGDEVEGDVRYLEPGHIQILFSAPFGGSAELS